MELELLSIGELARLVGLPVETVRTWDRRYGVPTLEKLPSGHRRYRANEVPRLRQMVRPVDAGHRPSEVAKMDRARLAQLVGEHTGGLRRHDEALIGQCIAAARAANEATILNILDNAFTRRPVMAVIAELISPLMQRVGQMWCDDQLSIYEEHFLTAAIERDLMRRWHDAQSTCSGASVLCMVPPSEQHVLGMHLGALILAQQGIPAIVLHAAPLEQVVHAARSWEACGVLLSVSPAIPTEVARAYIDQVAEEVRPLPVWVGGEDIGAEEARWLPAFEDLDEVASNLAAVRREAAAE